MEPKPREVPGFQNKIALRGRQAELLVFFMALFPLVSDEIKK